MLELSGSTIAVQQGFAAAYTQAFLTGLVGWINLVVNFLIAVWPVIMVAVAAIIIYKMVRSRMQA